MRGFPGSSKGKESACNAGDLGSIAQLGRSFGEGNGYPFQYSCLENSMDRGAWQATVHGVTKNQSKHGAYLIGRTDHRLSLKNCVYLCVCETERENIST